ncbi:MAG: hypothetical protein KatS3mg060_1986 [Dehalococcoidia bacterium]|nr:MAG: hypothetical protein KatS3mg060_1986 [Dehalococcoidia bacterium]
MMLNVDRQADAQYLALSGARANRSEEISSGIILDCDEQDRVVGIEVLYVSKRAPKTALRRLLFESVSDVA